MAIERTCPLCRRPTVWAGNDHRPFCSERCRLLDMGAWASETYRIAAQEIGSDAVDDEEIAR